MTYFWKYHILFQSNAMDFIGDIDLVGLLSVVIFYFIILGVGMWAAKKKSNVEGVSEEVGFFLKWSWRLWSFLVNFWFIDTLTDSIFGVVNGTKRCNVEGVRKEVGFFLKWSWSIFNGFGPLIFLMFGIDILAAIKINVEGDWGR